MNFHHMRLAVACALLTLALAACGGGGGGSGSSGNSPPRFTSPTSFEFYENTPIRFVVTADDPDGDLITIRDDATGDGALFMVTISDTGGGVTLVPPRTYLDFENPEDVDRDNVYEQRITLSDGKSSTTTTIRVRVLDVDEPPEFVTSPVLNAGSVTIDWQENYTGQLFTFTAEDPEGRPITYRMINPAGSMNPDFETYLEIFSLDPVTGILSAEKPFDYETGLTTGHPFSGGSVGIWIEASDGSLTARVWASIRFVDVLATTSHGLRLIGDEPSAPVGDNAFSIGDIDGDGLGEVWLSQRPLQAGNSGYFLWGGFFENATAGGRAANLSLSDLTPEQSIHFVYSSGPNATFVPGRYHAISAGDVDGDGIQDLLVAFYESPLRGPADNRWGPAGAIVFGSALRANNTGVHDFNSAPASSQVMLAGFSAAELAGLTFASGDFDGDGRSDIAIGSPEVGDVRVIFSSAITGARSAGQFDVRLASSGQMISLRSEVPARPLPHLLGTRLAGMKDINGDGIDELIVNGEHFVNTASIEPTTGATIGTAYQNRLYVIPGGTLRDLRASGIAIFDIHADIDDADIAYFHTDTSVVVGINVDGDLDGDGINDIVLTQSGKGLNQRFATVIFGSTVRTALTTGTDVSMDFSDPAQGVVLNLLDQQFTQFPSVQLPIAFARGVAPGNGDGLIIGLPDEGDPGSWNAGAILVLDSLALGRSATADITFSVDAIPQERGRKFIGIPTANWMGAYVLGQDLDGDGIGDMSFGTATVAPGGDDQFLGGFYMLPGRLVREAFDAPETVVELEPWISVEQAQE